MGGWMVTRYEQVDRVLRSPAFRTPRGYREPGDPAGPPLYDPDGVATLHRRHWLLFTSGDAHARLRKLIMKVFTPRADYGAARRVVGAQGLAQAPALKASEATGSSDTDWSQIGIAFGLGALFATAVVVAVRVKPGPVGPATH